MNLHEVFGLKPTVVLQSFSDKRYQICPNYKCQHPKVERTYYKVYSETTELMGIECLINCPKCKYRFNWGDWSIDINDEENWIKKENEKFKEVDYIDNSK